jgi:hypothetical protein
MDIKHIEVRAPTIDELIATVKSNLDQYIPDEGIQFDNGVFLQVMRPYTSDVFIEMFKKTILEQNPQTFATRRVLPQALSRTPRNRPSRTLPS